MRLCEGPRRPSSPPAAVVVHAKGGDSLTPLPSASRAAKTRGSPPRWPPLRIGAAIVSCARHRTMGATPDPKIGTPTGIDEAPSIDFPAKCRASRSLPRRFVLAEAEKSGLCPRDFTLTPFECLSNAVRPYSTFVSLGPLSTPLDWGTSTNVSLCRPYLRPQLDLCGKV